MSVKEAIESLGVITLKVLRPRTGSYQGGIHQEGAADEIEIKGMIQPLSALQLQQLPEGFRASGTMNFYTIEEIKTGDEGDSAGPDVVIYNGNDYVVRGVTSWVGEYKKALIEEVSR